MNDIHVSLKYDEKDARWRWLVEFGIAAKAGEERMLDRAFQSATVAAYHLLDGDDE